MQQGCVLLQSGKHLYCLDVALAPNVSCTISKQDYQNCVNAFNVNISIKYVIQDNLFIFRLHVR